MSGYRMNLLCFILLVFMFSCVSTQKKCPTSTPGIPENADDTVIVMTPSGKRSLIPHINRKPFTLAERPGSLENRTVYLVDIGFGGSATYMTQLERWFNRNMTSVNVIQKRKKGNVFIDDPADANLWREIRSNDGAVIIGVAG